MFLTSSGFYLKSDYSTTFLLFGFTSKIPLSPFHIHPELHVQSADAESIGLLSQKAERGTLNMQYGGTYSYSYRKSNFTLGTLLKAIVDDFQSNNNRVAMEEAGYSTKNDLKNNNYVFMVSPQYTYNDRTRKVLVRVRLPFSYHVHDVDYKSKDDKRIDLWNVEPDFLFRYDMTDDWKVSLDYSHKRQLGDVLDFVDVPVMQNYQYVSVGSGILERRNSDTYTMRLIYRNDIDALFFNLSATYRSMDANVVSGTVFTNDYILNYTAPLSNERKQKIVNASLSKFVDALRTTVVVSGSYTDSNLSRFQQGQLFPWNTDSYQCQMNFDSKVASWLNVNGKFSYLTTWYDDGENEKRNSRHWRGIMGVYVMPIPKFFFSFSGEYNWNETGGTNADRCFFLDAKVNYKSKLWDWEIVWQNLLNKDLYENVSFGNLSSTSVAFPLRKSNIVTSVRFSF